MIIVLLLQLVWNNFANLNVINKITEHNLNNLIKSSAHQILLLLHEC